MEEKIIYPFDGPKFMAAWELWLKFRKEIKKPIKGPISMQAQLKKLSTLADGNEEKAIAIIEQSICNNWQGLFNLKNTSTNGRITAQQGGQAFQQFWANFN